MVEGFYPPGLVFGDEKEANDPLLIRTSGLVAVRVEAILKKGRPVGWRRHLRGCRKCKGEEVGGNFSGVGGDSAWRNRFNSCRQLTRLCVVYVTGCGARDY